MTPEMNKQRVRAFMEKGFNQGDLSAVDDQLLSNSVDHQEPAGADFVTHLKQVIVALRTAFPDLHFEIHDILAEDDLVAFRSTMTGTHLGRLQMGPGPGLNPTGRTVSVPHMHMVRMQEGKGSDLWHLWDSPEMMRQLGVQSPMPQPER
jgi:predicted ester cyclase